MNHYHAYGEPEDVGRKRTKRDDRDNGCCRCEAHIAGPLMATRERPSCQMVCYMCERVEILTARLGGE